MVQLKYFGDSRDYFKYDLITSILVHSSLCSYVFVPMLTEHRHDNEGKKEPRNQGDKSAELLDFIKRCEHKSLGHWRDWLGRHAGCYKTLEPVNEIHFSDETRYIYWRRFQSIIRAEHSLIFIDPDTGLETGKPSYLRKMGREKYILNDELMWLIEAMDSSSVLMLYQHLPADKHKHKMSVKKKLRQIRCADPTAYGCVYREDDLAFLFVSKTKKLDEEIRSLLTDYHVKSRHRFKSLHS